MGGQSRFISCKVKKRDEFSQIPLSTIRLDFVFPFSLHGLLRFFLLNKQAWHLAQHIHWSAFTQGITQVLLKYFSGPHETHERDLCLETILSTVIRASSSYPNATLNTWNALSGNYIH